MRIGDASIGGREWRRVVIVSVVRRLMMGAGWRAKAKGRMTLARLLLLRLLRLLRLLMRAPGRSLHHHVAPVSVPVSLTVPFRLAVSFPFAVDALVVAGLLGPL